MHFLQKLSTFLSRLLIWIAGGFMLGMVFLTCSNIVVRLFSVPISGTFELMGYFGAVTAGLSLGYTQIRKGHIFVDILYESLPKTVKKVCSLLNSILCFCFFAFISQQLLEWGNTLRVSGQVSETLNFAYYPFVFGVALGCASLCLVFFLEILFVFAKEEGR